MNANNYLEYIKIALMVWGILVLMEILRYIKLIWSDSFDIHKVIVHRQDPKLFGGGD